MRRAVLAVMVVALAVAAEAADTVVRRMTPALIEEAVAKGTESCYALRVEGQSVACFTTPYSRVVGKAKLAQTAQRSVGAFPPDVLAPELGVFVRPRDGNRAVSVAVARKGGAAIQPLGTEADPLGLRARFPLSALADGNEVRVVFEGPACGGKNECVAPLYLEGVR